MENFASGGAISFHIGPIFKGQQPFEELKLEVREPVFRQNWIFGPILWPLMNTTSTKYENLDNFWTRGTTGFDFGASGNWKWPIRSLSYHENVIRVSRTARRGERHSGRLHCDPIFLYFLYSKPKTYNRLGRRMIFFSEFFMYFKYVSLFLWISYFAEVGLHKPLVPHIIGT